METTVSVTGEDTRWATIAVYYFTANERDQSSEIVLPPVVLSPRLGDSPSPVLHQPTPVPEPTLIPLTPSPASCHADDTMDWQLLLNLEGG